MKNIALTLFILTTLQGCGGGLSANIEALSAISEKERKKILERK